MKVQAISQKQLKLQSKKSTIRWTKSVFQLLLEREIRRIKNESKKRMDY